MKLLTRLATLLLLAAAAHHAGGATKPSITTQPAATSVVIRDNAVLEVAATGTEPFSYQWYVGAAGNTANPVPGATGHLLLTPPMMQTTRYWVRVTNEAGYVNSRSVSVSVTARPQEYALWDMGANTSGQLGDGTATGRASPRYLATGVTSVSAGHNHTLFLKSDGRLWGMGRNEWGQLGEGTTENRLSPVHLATGVVATSAGGSHSLFLKADNTLWAMGQNYNGQLGNGAMGENKPNPLPLQAAPTVATDVLAVAAGEDHSLFLKSNGTLWAMGYNGWGQLGCGNTTDQPTPVQIATGVAAIAAGGYHSLFVKTNGDLYAMGSNMYGELGDDSGLNRSTPVLVDTDVVSVAAGRWHSLYVKAGGTLHAMGFNITGQLGDSGTDDQYAPVQTGVGASAAAGGEYHSLFVGIDDALWGSGSDGDGQLGIGAGEVHAFTSVDGGVLQASAGLAHSAFLKEAPQPWFPETILVDSGTGCHPSMLWRNLTSGDVALWLMNGTSTTASATIYNSGTDWTVEHVADFNGDGEDDILWRSSSTGAHFISLMNSPAVLSQGTLYTPDINWEIIACGDYSGDGRADLLWRNNANGEVVIFIMNGLSITSGWTLLAAGQGWSPIPAVADLDGNGVDDILWRKDNNAHVAAWLMGANAAFLSGGTIYDPAADPVGMRYTLVTKALGDFNADGKTDLVWRRNSSATTVLWLMNGTAVAGAATVYNGSPEWLPAGAGDINADGRDDLFWRNATSGEYAVYLMNCGPATVSVSAGAVIYSYNTDWTIEHMADFNGDGTTDLVWRSASGGNAALWLMNGFSAASSATLYP